MSDGESTARGEAVSRGLKQDAHDPAFIERWQPASASASFAALSSIEKHQSIVSRLFWFAIGGGLSVGINTSIYFLIRDRLGWSESGALAVSLVVVTTAFAIWNYRLNFRTSRAWRECLARYLAVVAFCFTLNYAVGLTGIKQLGSTNLRVFLVLFTVQALVSGVKFLLYHYWVYPRATPSAGAGETIGMR